jgi:uncharacterized membrane protein
MIRTLSTLNDGVIAIFITVMMLGIPYPTSEWSYFDFLWSILVFWVSFFIIAGFWYDNKVVFLSMREADHLVVIANFLFLAVLALITCTVCDQNNVSAQLTYRLDKPIAVEFLSFVWCLIASF